MEQSISFKDIHIIGASIGAGGTLDSNSLATLELARQWAALGAAVTLYTDHEGYLLAQSHNLLNVVYCVWPTERWRRFGRPVHLAAKSLICWINGRRIKTDGLIYSASASLADVLASQQARRHNPEAKWISTIKTVNPKYLIRYVANAAVTSQLERNSDLFFAAGDVSKTSLAGRFGDRAHILRLGISAAALQAPPAKRKRYDACFIAASESISGWSQLAAAWQHVQTYKPGAKLAIMISGREKVQPIVRRLFAKRGLDKNITWIFNPDEPTKQRTLLAGRLFIAPFADADSVFIGEAMAVGLPVIGFDFAALKFDYSAGRMTVPVGDWASLGHLVIHILNHRGLYLRLKKQAKTEALTHDWNNCAGQALEFMAS